MNVYVLLLFSHSLWLSQSLSINKKLFSYYPKKLGIINGKEAIPHQFPYQVGMYINGEDFCGGSLISSNYVLTAAHCTEKAESIELILGAHYIEKEEHTQIRQISRRFITHPEWNRGSLVNDIALVRLAAPVNETESIRKVMLGFVNDDYAGQRGLVAGWGKVNDDINDVSPTLQYITSRIMSNEECKSFNRAYDEIMDDTKMCLTGRYGGRVASTCQGDSGGPVMSHGVQVGIVSFGWPRCSEGYPSVNTRVNKFKDWIRINSDINY